ncbi:hypothetical protein FOA52_009385, partial [Chlamydomonas sp. UWO 241]
MTDDDTAAGSMQSVEAALSQRWQELAARQCEAGEEEQRVVVDKTQWFSDAWAFLSTASATSTVRPHWWCEHTGVAEGIAELLAYHEPGNATVAQVWGHMDSQLRCCFSCINEYHRFQDQVPDLYASPDTLLTVMAGLDAQRVEAGLALVTGLDADQTPPTQLLCALYEGLSFPGLLEDAVVAGGVARAACTLRASGYDLTESGRFTGLYKLLASPDEATRAEMHSVVLELGRISSWEDAESCRLDTVLAHWLAAVTAGGNALLPPPPSDDGIGDGERDGDGEPAPMVQALAPMHVGRGRVRAVQTRDAMWGGLRAVTLLLDAPALSGCASTLTAYLPAVFSASGLLPGSGSGGGDRGGGFGVAARASAGSSAGYSHSGAMQGGTLSREAASIQRCALTCARTCLGALAHPEAWRALGVPAGALVDGCASAFATAATPSFRPDLAMEVLHTCRALLGDLMRAATPLDREALQLLTFLHHQVWAHSGPIPRLARSTAARAAFDSLLSAFGRGYASGWACHAWGGAACALVARGGVEGADGDDHLQAGVSAVLSAVCRTDASVLGCLLEPWRLRDRHASASGSKHLARGAPASDNDSAREAELEAGCEVALDNIEAFRCAPAYYRSLASSHHPIASPRVAAALLAAAAHLAGAAPGGRDAALPPVPMPLASHGGPAHSWVAGASTSGSGAGGSGGGGAGAHGGFLIGGDGAVSNEDWVAQRQAAARAAAQAKQVQAPQLHSGSGGGGRGHRLGALGRLPPSLEALLAWQPWCGEWEEQCVRAADYPHTLLALLRDAT